MAKDKSVGEPYGEFGSELLGDELIRKLRTFAMHASPNQKLSSPRELAREHGISLSTARRAVDALVHEGVLYSHRGKGTFVADTRMRIDVRPCIVYSDVWGKNMSHAFYYRSLQGVLAQATEYNFRVEIHKWPTIKDEVVPRLVDAVSRDEVGGVIVPWMYDWWYGALLEANPRLSVVSMMQQIDQPGTASVTADFESLGRLGVERLLRRSAKRVVVVNFMRGTYAGALQVDPALLDSATLKNLPIESIDDAVRQCREQSWDDVDGVLFDDDVICSNGLNAILERCPDFLETSHVVSYLTVGRDQLPPRVEGLEVDGYVIGQTVVSTLKAMIESGQFRGVSIRIRPKWLTAL